MRGWNDCTVCQGTGFVGDAKCMISPEPHDPPVTRREKLLKAAEFDKEEVSKIQCEYVNGAGVFENPDMEFLFNTIFKLHELNTALIDRVIELEGASGEYDISFANFSPDDQESRRYMAKAVLQGRQALSSENPLDALIKGVE